MCKLDSWTLSMIDNIWFGLYQIYLTSSTCAVGKMLYSLTYIWTTFFLRMNVLRVSLQTDCKRQCIFKYFCCIFMLTNRMTKIGKSRDWRWHHCVHLDWLVIPMIMETQCISSGISCWSVLNLFCWIVGCIVIPGELVGECGGLRTKLESGCDTNQLFLRISW